MNTDISEIVHIAIEMMQKTFDGTKVELNCSKMRLQPNQYYPGDKLGVDIKIEGIKFFLGYSEIEDMIVYGIHIAEQLVYNVLEPSWKNYIKNQKRKSKLNKILINE